MLRILLFNSIQGAKYEIAAIKMCLWVARAEVRGQDAIMPIVSTSFNTMFGYFWPHCAWVLLYLCQLIKWMDWVLTMSSNNTCNYLLICTNCESSIICTHSLRSMRLLAVCKIIVGNALCHVGTHPHGATCNRECANLSYHTLPICMKLCTCA